MSGRVDVQDAGPSMGDSTGEVCGGILQRR